jgi:hypothetical protein
MLFRIARVSNIGLGLASVLWLSACGAHSLSAVLGTSSGPSGTSSTVSSPTSSSAGSTSAPSSTSSSSTSSSSDSTDNCPRSSDLPGQRPETYTGSNNSPFSARTDPEPTVCEIARENNHKWTRLVGYSVEEASKRAKAAGWDGKIEVHPLREYDAKCKEGMVCTLDPARWEIGAGSSLTLYVNHKVTISTPD